MYAILRRPGLWTFGIVLPLSLAWLAVSFASSTGELREGSGIDGVEGISAPHVFAVSPPPPPQSATLREVATPGLWRLTSITHAGDGRLFLTQQDGLVRILEKNELRPEPFLDLRGQTDHAGEDEQGLLSLAFHPRFAENGLFFACYTDLQGAVVVARYRVSAADPDRADPASRRIVLAVPSQHHHNGGQLQFGPDGYLYLGLGDGGMGGDPGCLAQQSTSLLGKILRLDVDSRSRAASPPYYTVPKSNPFRGSHPMPDEVWAYGLRNPWRFSFDRLTGDLWIGDVGQSAREEVDFQAAGSRGGQNYGWKVMEGTGCYSTTSCPAAVPPCGSSRITPPVLEYEQGHGDECGVTGGYVYRGRELPHLWGSYVFGDICNGRIWTAARKGDAWQVRELESRAKYLATFGEDRDGELYLGTIDGRVLRIVPQHPVDTPGLYDASQARFLLEDLFTGGLPDRVVRFGPQGAGWLPVTADWDGDGRTGLGLYDPEAGTFHLGNRLARGSARMTAPFDAPSPRALPLAGDWDGDGRDTVGVYDPETATVHLTNGLAGGAFEIAFRFGRAGDGLLPVSGDWDGDGRDSVGLYDPAAGLFLLRNALGEGPAELPADLEVRFGKAGGGCIPLAGDWNGDGRDGLGLYDPAEAVFRLRNTLRGPADVQVRFGAPASVRVPVAGEW